MLRKSTLLTALSALLLAPALIAQQKIELSTQVKGTLPVANGGTGSTTSTGTGATVKSTAPAIANPTITNPTLTDGTWDGKSSADLIDRSQETGEQPISATTGLQAALNSKVDDSQISAYGLTLVDDADAATARTTLGLGSAATSASTAFEAAGTVATGISGHAGAADPHPTYLTASEGNAAYAPLSHTQAISTVTGLQAAIDAKVDDSQISSYGLTLVDDADAAAARTTLGLGSAATSATTAFETAGAVATHAGAVDPHPTYLTATEGNAAYAPLSHTQAISTVTGLQAAIDAKVDDSQISAYGLTLIDDADAATARTTLGLGSAATSATTAFEAAGAVATGISGHTGAADPHPTYLTAAEGNAAYSAIGHGHTAANISDFNSAADTRADGRIAAASINALADVTVTTPSTGQVLKWNGSAFVNDTDNTGGIADGDKGDISVASGGTAWTIDAGAVTLADQANVATGTVFYRKTAGAGAPEVQTLATLKTDLGLTGSNSGDQTITLSGDVSGSGTGAITATLATVNAAPQTDTLRKITVNAKGLVTATSAVVAGDIPTLNQNTTGSAATLTTGRTFSISGDGTGTSATFNGSANASIPLTLATVNSNVGTFGSASLVPVVTVNAKGLVTAVSTVAVSGGGGGGSPGGSTTQIQYNDAGAFAGSANLAWDNANSVLDVAGTVQIEAVASEPAAPAANHGKLYAKDIAGRIVPKWIGPSGFDYVLQASLGQNRIAMWRGGATTTATTFAAQIGAMPYTGASPTAPTIPTLAVTNLKTQTFRSVISTGATAGGIAYIRGNQLSFWRGNAAGLGGFYVVHRFSLAGLQAGQRTFAGIVDVAANPTNIDPTTTTTPGGVGMAINTNSGNWNVVHNITGTARTVVPLGASFPVNTTSMFELALFCPPQCAAIGYRVTNLSTGAQTSGSLSSNIPASTTFMAPALWITNNATAAAATIDFVSTYVETDF